MPSINKLCFLFPLSPFSPVLYLLVFEFSIVIVNHVKGLCPFIDLCSEDTYLCFYLSCKLEWPHVLSDLQSTTVLDEVINEIGGGEKFSQDMINSNWEATAKKIHPLLSFSCWYTGVKMQLNWISCGVIIQLCLVGWTLMHSWNFCFLVQSHHVELSIKTCRGLLQSFCC